jgi:threonine dehydrogenase-like Zn-dependent dehydrogenase
MLAALLGVQRGLEVHVLDRNKEGPKPKLVRDLGANTLSEASEVGELQPDVIIECTGSTSVVREVLDRTGPSGILCLLSVTSSQMIELDLGSLNREMVLQNRVVFGAVNANRKHYRMAADALAHADRDHLARLITRRVPLARWSEALEHRRGDIKVIIDFMA